MKEDKPYKLAFYPGAQKEQKKRKTMKNNAFIMSLCILVSILMSISCGSNGISVADDVILDQLDLNISDGGGTLNGNIIVQLRDADGNTPAILETSFAASLLQSNPETWYPVTFSTCTLAKNVKYRIYVQRSIADPVNSTESINWTGNSSTGIDYYIHGQNDWAISAPGREHCDYGFRTYDNGVVDQSMEIINYSFADLSNDSWKWQEFIAGAE